MSLNLNIKADRKRAYRDLIFYDHGFLRYKFSNHHEIGKKMYRENQPSPKQIKKWKKLGIKTNINLRGKSDKGYYLLEKEACDQNSINMIDFHVYSRDVHSIETILNAQKLFSKIEYPAIMHCKSGADRTGFMGVLYKHFYMNEPIEVALSQLSLKYLHIKQGKTGILDFFFLDYLLYSSQRKISFLDWVINVYDPVELKAKFMKQWSGNPITELILRRE
ncbi:tyrosine-protein phosphatase [Hellea sp.]|nr:tyrosine-protein phosphatase [Hellea sp.]